MIKKERVVVAMSGGVDSSVAALILKERGYDVIGVTIQLLPKGMNFGGCCSISDIEDARKVARILGIKHYVLNMRKTFKEKVINDFCREYINGRTPNPCIRCNEHIKFDELLRKARELDSMFIATGHYARIENVNGDYLLKKGIDHKKDQSYVLYSLVRDKLSYILMPLGYLTKIEVRNLAKKYKLPVAEKEDSQEICFVEDRDYAFFVKSFLSYKPEPGIILDTKGDFLGEHKGIINYTIGQRRGLGISSKKPLYIIEINRDKNTIVVGEKEEVYFDNCIVKYVNFISIDKLNSHRKVNVKIRYNANETPGLISPLHNSQIEVKFNMPQFAVTKGQSVVFYDKDIVIGGGIIDMVKRRDVWS